MFNVINPNMHVSINSKSKNQSLPLNLKATGAKEKTNKIGRVDMTYHLVKYYELP